MKVTSEMYTTLFNGITDAKKHLIDAMNLLDSIQQKSEDLYITQDNKAEEEK